MFRDYYYSFLFLFHFHIFLYPVPLFFRLVKTPLIYLKVLIANLLHSERTVQISNTPAPYGRRHWSGTNARREERFS
ncbi:hypothetical protein PFDG_05165, partial [Plasmodium falciparum Dd2]